MRVIEVNIKIRQVSDCLGKDRYVSYSEAEKVLNRMSSKQTLRNNLDRKVHIYSCSYCNSFHIGGKFKNQLDDGFVQRSIKSIKRFKLTKGIEEGNKNTWKRISYM